MTDLTNTKFPDIETIIQGLGETGYVCSREIGLAIMLARHLQKPLLVEGTAGVGKTEMALATAAYTGLPLIRMQCYEGLDDAKALYEWKYGKQLLYTQILKDKVGSVLGDTDDLRDAMTRLHGFSDLFFAPEFLEPRPLLKALQAEEGAVLLIDEIDKADEEFEAFLLEILSANQVTIPEIGTITAKTPPIVFLTSNNYREMSDALKRRCIHLHVPLPEAKLERQIVNMRVPGIDDTLSRQLVGFVQALRDMDLRKLPSISETIDWARALVLLNASELGPQLVRDTLNLLLKHESDIEMTTPKVVELVQAAKTAR